MPANNKMMSWTGWVITALVALMLAFSASMKFMNPPDFTKEWERLGYPPDLAVAIGVVELACAVVYLIPQTAILGAVLPTGYLGGAVATHVRIHDDFIPPVIGGVLVWLALVLRDPRLRVLLPIRRALPSATESKSQ